MPKKFRMFRGAMEEAKELLEVPPSIQLYANKQAVVEGAHGIIEYTDELIRVSYGEGEARFYGSNLSLGCLSRDSLEITGRIERIEYA